MNSTASASVLKLVHLDLTNSLGTISIGSSFSIFLLGVVTSQVYYYFVRFWRKDGRWYHAMVATVWLLEVAHTACASYDIYRATITAYGQPWKLTTYPGIASTTATGGAITLLVQSFYAHRLTRVLPRPWSLIGWTCIILSFLRFGAAIYLAHYAMTVTDLGHYAGKVEWLVSTVLAVGAAIDVSIAAAMLYYLKQKRDEGLDRITAVIEKLMEYTIRTGALTSIWAIILLILFQTMPDNWTWIAIYMVLAKLYSTSLLSTLNSRIDIRDKLAICMDTNEGISKQATPYIDREMQFRYNGSQAISIEMHTSTKITNDDDARSYVRAFEAI